MISYSTILITAVVAYSVWYFQSLFVNYRAARRSRFPIFVSPVNHNNLIWIVVSVTLRPVLARCLPSFLYDRIIPTIYGWEFHYRNQVFDRLGLSFMLVTPGGNELWVADPEIAHVILTRPNAFIQLDIPRRKLGAPKIFFADMTSRYYGDVWPKYLYCKHF